jgi:hypothetical protein
MRVSFGISLITLSLALAASVRAQAGQAKDCSSPPSLPTELAGWSSRVSIAAASDRSAVDQTTLTIGKAVDATLRKTPEVKYVTLPDRPGGSVSYGGMFSFEVDRAGTYRVAIASGAWIDILEDGQAVQSTAHGHGPDCSGIRKMVDYPLKPGHHVLQLSGNADPTLSVLVTRLP